MQTSNWIDLGIVGILGLSAIVSGFRNRKKASRNIEEYFLAGRSLSGWKAGLSMAATQFAADTPLLVVGLIAVGGIFELWRLWIYAIAFLLMGFLLSSSWRKAGVLTDAELAILRYGSGRDAAILRTLKAVYYGFLINCAVMAMVLMAAMRIFEVFLPWHLILPADFYSVFLYLFGGFHFESGLTSMPAAVASANNCISLIVLLLFVMLYSVTGGLRSVVSTDVAQFLIMMFAMLVYAVVLVMEAGGIDQLSVTYQGLYGDQGLSFAPDEDLFAFWSIIAIQWLFQINSDGTGYLAQRTMACKTDRDARHAAVIFTTAQILFRSLLWIFIAVALLVLYPAPPDGATSEYVAGREALFIFGMNEYLPVGIRGLLLAAMLAALASTIDTHLNWGASYFTNDLYRPLMKKLRPGSEMSSAGEVLVARMSGFIILSLSIAVMSFLDSIQSAWKLTLLFGAGMGPVLVLRWLWEKITVYSEFAALTGSLIAAPLLLLFIEEEWMRMLFMAGISVICILLSLLIPENKIHREARLRFFEKTEPAGFWKNTAIATGRPVKEPLHKFTLGSFRILGFALVLYALLYGAVQLVF